MDGKFVEQKKQKELDYQRKNDRIRMEEHSGTEILGSKKIENDKIKYREYTQKESHTAHDTIQNDIVSRKDCKSDAIQGTTENQPSEKTMHVLKMNEVHEVHIPPKHEIQKESNNLQEKGALVNEKLEDLAKILDCYEGFVNANKDKKDNSEIFSKFCSSFVALSDKIRDLSASAADISEAYKNMIEATSIYFNKNNKFKWSSKGRKRRDITGDILNKCKGLDDSIFAFETAHAIEEENDNTNNENSDLEATVQENNTEEIKEETNKNEQAIKDEETINVINDEAGQDMIENEEKAPEELTFEVSEDTINDLVGGILKKEDKKTFFKGGTRSFVLGGRYLKIAGDITKKLLRRKIDNSNLKSEEDYKKLDLENVARGSFMKLNDIFDANKKMLDTYMANGFAGKCQDKNLKNALAISGYREKLMDKIMESIGENMFLETSKAKEGVENKDDLFFDTFIESYNMEEDSLRDKNYEDNVTYFMEQLEKTMPKGWDMPKFFENKVINFIVSTTDHKDIEKSFEGFKNQLDENIKTIKEQLGRKISPFSRDKVMKSLMENIDYRLLIFNAHAISDYTADYCHNLMAKNIEAGVIENKLNYYIRKYNIPQKYSRIAKEHLFEDIKTKDINPENLDIKKDANAIKSILEKYGRSVTENEALFNDSMDLELSDNEWKEVFKEKKSAIFSDKKDFEKWINETKNQYKERTIENHEKYYKLDSILYKMRKKGEPEIQEKEDNRSVESIKDMLEGSLFLGSCVYDDYLEVNSTDTKTKEENNKKDEKAQKLLEEKEKLKIKNNKDFVLNTIMSLINEGKYKDKLGIPADIKTWDELSTLPKSKQQEFVAFLDHNLGSNVERLMNLPVTYRSRLKEDCLKEVLLGNIRNEDDFEAKIKEFTKQYAKDDKFDEKRLDIRLRGRLEFNKDVKYDYMRVQGSDRSILGFFSMPGSNVYKQSDRARHIKQAGRAWELIKNKNLYMETCSLIQLLQNELLDKKMPILKRK